MPKTSGSFKPGVSGNPAGRRKGVDALARECIDEREIFALLLKKAREGDVRAMELALAYTIGKPKQQMDINLTAARLVDVSNFTMQQLEVLSELPDVSEADDE